ncbi:putative reverse transcriptase domain-containing protein [Tanacetum coccineum]
MLDGVAEFVDDTNFALDIPIDGPIRVEMVNVTKDNFDEDDLVKFQELLLDAEKPLYEECPDFTKLSAIAKLLNLKGKYVCSDKFFTELLGLIKKMLPADNKMVEKTYQAKKVMKLMGSGYKKIHVCINNCLLYWKDDKDLTACRTCGISRWKVDNKTHKVYKNIPAKRITDGISADGVDVNTGNRHHSVWPVLTVIYNLPPWLCMKRKFIMLSVLISGYPGNDIDVFLEPLVDDLHTLFETGVDTYDASTKDNFNLRAVVLWTINDYPALGTLCGCPYSGFKGCVVCGKDTNCVRLSASSKQSYVGHKRYLPYNHPFIKQKKAFNGQQEFIPSPIPMTGEQIYNEVQHIKNKWGKGKQTNNKASENQEYIRGRGGKIQKHKRNTTEDEGSSSQVTDKTMCIGRNSTFGIKNLGKTKDGVNARLDLAELGVKPELFAMQEEDKTTLPPQVERELAISKESVSETIRWISYRPRATVVKYDAYNINGYTFCMKCHDGKVYQNSGVSVEAIDLHISKEVATTRQAFYYGVLKKIWVLDYHFRQIPLFKYDWVNLRAGGVKRDTTLGYTLVDLNNLGHKVDQFILASQARQVFYVKDQIDKKLSIIFKTPPKN